MGVCALPAEGEKARAGDVCWYATQLILLKHDLGSGNADAMTDTLNTLVDVAYLLLTSKSRRERYPGYTCTVKKVELAW